MPTFQLNKLVRDKLPAIYKSLGQKASLKKQTKAQHSKALLRKIIEETTELMQVKKSKKELIDEVADIQQVIDDFKKLQAISDIDVKNKQHKKSKKTGGFLNGKFVQTLELKDEDAWVKYYRAEPSRFPELGDD